METLMCLSDLKPRESAVVKKIEGVGELKSRLVDMGILPGVKIEVLKLAPLGDPMDIWIKGYQLSLRKDEAKQIKVEVVE